MKKLVTGLHHVTAMTSDPQKNLDFYAGILGLRLVKKTVNFDAPEIYHFYYGNESGAPGTIITFFPLAQLGQTLKLPPWEEPFREDIERLLPPIHLDLKKFAD